MFVATFFVINYLFKLTVRYNFFKPVGIKFLTENNGFFHLLFTLYKLPFAGAERRHTERQLHKRQSVAVAETVNGKAALLCIYIITVFHN